MGTQNIFHPGNHCALWSLTQRAACWDGFSPGQLALVGLLHIGPVSLTFEEPLNKHIWRAQDDQDQINQLDFTHLPSLVPLGPGKILLLLFSFPVLHSPTSVPLELGSSLPFVFQVQMDADLLLCLTCSPTDTQCHSVSPIGT